MDETPAIGHLPTRYHHDRRLITGVVVGIVAIIARIVVPYVPGIVFSVSLAQAQNVCNGALGAFAQAMDHRVVTACGEANGIMVALNLAALAGLVAAGICGFLLYRNYKAAH
jgi:hypothetical protein